MNFLLAFIFAFAISFTSFKYKLLTKSGAISAFVLGFIVFAFGGIKFTLPLITFFLTSSLLSKIRKNKNKIVEEYFDKSGTRDGFQVFANGGLGIPLVISNYIFHSEIFYLYYISVFAAVCADTWATEFGTMFKTKTYNILNFKIAEQGISGGISLNGIFASVSASILISISALNWIEINLNKYFMMIIFSGVLGSLTDSFLGAALQLQMKCKVCNKITERKIHCGENTIYFKGIKSLNNDAVNFLTGLSAIFYTVILNEVLF